MNTLSINNLTIKINQETLLQNVSFDITAGEIVVVIGPNGAGKSSLLKAIMQDMPISRGCIKINQQKINQPLVTDKKNQAKQVAVLPQFSLLSFPYTVHEVVSLSRIPHSTGLTIDNAIISEVLQAMDISHLRERLYTRLSGGEKQRVQLARVLAQIWRAEDVESDKQRLLLLDEPTIALDLGHQQMLMQTLSEFAKTNKQANNKVAVLMVLHDINLAARYADKLLALSAGKTLAYGTPKQVLTKKTLQQLFHIDVRIMSHPDSGEPVVLNV